MTTATADLSRERWTGTCPVCHDRHMTFALAPRARRNGSTVWDRAECGGCGSVVPFSHTHPATGRICFTARERGCPSRVDGDFDTCPEHGEQVVVSYSATRGPDPYAVNHLACGHRVACFGPGEPNVIL